MIPTTRLRFVKRPYTIKADAFTQQPARLGHSMILQQLWESDFCDSVLEMEWRDVPVVSDDTVEPQ